MRVISPHRVEVESYRQRSLHDELLETTGSALFRLVKFVLRHSLALIIVPYGLWTLEYNYGPAAAIAPPVAVLVGLVVWWRLHRDSFTEVVVWRVRARWRAWWVYSRHWRAAMHLSGLGVRFEHADYMPDVRRIIYRPYLDRVLVRMLPGQRPDDYEAAADGLAHSFSARACRVRTDKPRHLWLEFATGDPLTEIIPALPVPDDVDLTAVPIGRTEYGEPWIVNLIGATILIAGSQGAGKGSVLWSIVRGVAGSIRSGEVEVWALDPKGGLELSPGEGLFARFVYNPRRWEDFAELLEDALVEMNDRIDRLRGVTRKHTPSVAEPLILLVVDEMANLTAYLPDRQLRQRIAGTLSELLSKGRAVGVVTIAALQDPRKDVLPFRDLFTTRIALRLMEKQQVWMVLGDEAHDRGATCERIPKALAGVGYVMLDGDREPTRVRAAYPTDADITAMATDYPAGGDWPTLDPLTGEIAPRLDPAPDPEPDDEEGAA
jgi:S-DNA-T family DNA segregation ATPase FtsK/SpoIIIE